MAVTRIKNNQITDATVNAAAKLVDYSVTAAKIANNLVYSSDLTVTGNLTVQGNTTTIDTTYTVIEDPVITLASNQTGAPAVDIGFIGERGTANNIAFVWDESAGEFITAFTTTTETNTVISIASYADFHTANANIGGNIVVNGTASIVGNIIGNVSFSGNLSAGNLLTSGQMSAGGNVTGGNIVTGGVVTATGNIVSSANINATSGFINASAVLASGRVEAGTTMSAAGNITGANLITGGLITATGNVTGGNITTAGQVSATANVTGGNLLTAGQVSSTGNITSAANISGGNVLATTAVSASSVLGSIVSASANITGGNILTGGLISSTGNITSAANVAGGNLVATTAVVTPTIIGTTVTISATGSTITLAPTSNVSISSKNINNLADPVQNQDAATKIYVDNMASTQLSYHQGVTAATTGTLETATGGTITYNQPNGAGNGVGATLTVSGGSFNLIDTANIQTANTRVLIKNQANAVLNGVYVWSNATVLTRSTDADTYGPNSVTDLSINDYFFVSSGNVNKGSAWIVDAPSGTITFGTSNITFAQFSSSQTYTANTQAGISLTGTVFSALVDNNTTAFDGNGNIIVKAGANLTTPNIGAATGTSLSVTGNLTAAGAAISGNVSGGNILTGGLISATSTITSAANITGGNVLTGGIVSATGNVTGGNVVTAGQVSATANVTGGNVLTGGIVSATGNITSAANVAGGNVIATTLVQGATVSASGNVIGGNVTTAGQVSATGNITGGNVNTTSVVGSVVSMSGNITGANLNTGGTNGLTLNASTINSNAGRISVNSAASDVDFAVSGLTANVFYVDAGTGTASFGNATQTTNAIVAFNSTNSILPPVGTTGQRPGTGVLGMIRFNSTTDTLEQYASGGWEAIGTPAFTVVSDQQFNGDGATVAFTLSANATTNGVVVSINGVVQIPTSAYSVSGVTLTFTEAPQSGDLIDVRNFTTTTSVASISNSSGNAAITLSDTSNAVSITGDLLPVANITQSLGNSTLRWKDLWVGGNSIYLGNVVMKNVAGGNTIGFYGPDGTTPATIASTSVDTTTISNGTSNVTVASSGGNIRINVGGTSNVAVFDTTGLSITGNLTVTGNATLSGNILGDRVQNGTTSFDIQTASGNANITVGGTSNVVVYATTGEYITGLISASGNITSAANVAGGNVLATTTVSAASHIGTTVSVSGNVTGAGAAISGNVSGGNVLTGGLISSTGNITSAANIAGGNLLSTSGQISTGGNITAANFITGGVLSIAGNIVATGSNATANIGSATTYFNVVHAKATSAQYADLAEMYAADGQYEPGTVMSFGGSHEVTVSSVASDARIAGVVSTNPSYIMNATLDGDHVVAIALTGRVPTRVIGPVAKGDMMVSAGNGHAQACATPAVGTVIGKALENFDGAEGVIEVVVGRL